jgi:signal transduction histidine kinase
MPFARAAVIFFIMEISGLFSGPLPRIGLNVTICLTFSGILFIPKSWWNRKRVMLAGCIVMFETALGVYWFAEWKLLYFAAIITFAATVHLSLSKSPMAAMAVMFITALLYIRFGGKDVFNLFSFILFAIVLYIGMRSRMQRNKMYELNKRHLSELQEAYDRLQEASATAMRYAVLEERSRIARDIHDAVGHSLTSMIVQLQALRYMIDQDPPQAKRSLENMLAIARQGLHDIRISVHSLGEDRAISGILPLKALLSRMEASTSIRYTFHSEFQDEEISAEASGILFRVLQEAITNVIRHSGATELEVALIRKPGSITLQIRDNGALTTKEQIREGFGLHAMRARLEENGGSLHYSIAEPRGLELTAEIPNAEQQYGHPNEQGE